ncbi:unnamed protein product [Staurois parvus]|uniref:Uncharacterized protein n=1 Tax=Staurois parvus TaxID=386267 RepID=A0ABN9CA51_9NEOB|nr:unnamed protein product [Staurois parvus]
MPAVSSGHSGTQIIVRDLMQVTSLLTTCEICE